MMSFTLDQLYGWINAFFWPFVRLAALIGTAPLFGESSIPIRAKVGLAAVLTVAVAPAIGPLPGVAPASFEGFGIAIRQILIGVAMGLTMRVAFAAVQTAGEFVGLQMGLSFASFFDPSTGANTAVLSRLFNIVATLVFLALDGHLLVLSALVRSFDTLPIAATPLHAQGWGVLTEWGAQVIVSGLLMSLPIIAALLTINLAMGILNRSAPQLSVFAVGFPVSLLVGAILLTLILPQTTPFLERLFNSAFEACSRMLLELRDAAGP